MHCPAEEWIRGSEITLECSVLKSKFPKLCVTHFVNVVRFRKRSGNAAYTDVCTLSAVTGACIASSSGCRCQPGNATHYKFKYALISGSDSDGYWNCYVPCFKGMIAQLTYGSDNCDKGNVGKNRAVCVCV